MGTLATQLTNACAPFFYITVAIKAETQSSDNSARAKMAKLRKREQCRDRFELKA